MTLTLGPAVVVLAASRPVVVLRMGAGAAVGSSLQGGERDVKVLVLDVKRWVLEEEAEIVWVLFFQRWLASPYCTSCGPKLTSRWRCSFETNGRGRQRHGGNWKQTVKIRMREGKNKKKPLASALAMLALHIWLHTSHNAHTELHNRVYEQVYASTRVGRERLSAKTPSWTLKLRNETNKIMEGGREGGDEIARRTNTTARKHAEDKKRGTISGSVLKAKRGGDSVIHILLSSRVSHNRIPPLPLFSCRLSYLLVVVRHTLAVEPVGAVHRNLAVRRSQVVAAVHRKQAHPVVGLLGNLRMLVRIYIY